MRALYAAAVATLDTAGFVVWAVWIVCMFVLAVIALALVGSVVRAVF